MTMTSAIYYIIKCIALIGFLGFFTYEDIKEKQISNRILIAMLIVGVIFTCVSFNTSVIVSSFVCALITGAITYLTSLISRGGLGKGDVILLTITALFIGDLSMVYIVFLSLLAMFLFTIVALLLKKINVKSKLPYVPFLLIGTILGSII